MRFYFHLVGPSGAIPDDTGFEARSLEAAEAESRQAIQAIRDDGMFAGDDREGWQLEITDASHQVLLTIPLGQSQEDHGMKRSWLAASKRATWINTVLLAMGCGIDWQSPFAML
ncbi:hypothetical protein [Microvirga sp. VF16]|uniref:DUF6894 family protein n=1 Tax=Microvirga sp. VF16 TaxID=2807101 RepID=UPI00193D0897|nr:hypothetical protein [Microvirga sp. VF16]QRM29039.1 hypothetical protein JO965_23085 [Microvirga sp. VF16]